MPKLGFINKATMKVIGTLKSLFKENKMGLNNLPAWGGIDMVLGTHFLKLRRSNTDALIGGSLEQLITPLYPFSILVGTFPPACNNSDHTDTFACYTTNLEEEQDAPPGHLSTAEPTDHPPNKTIASNTMSCFLTAAESRVMEYILEKEG